MPAITLCDVVLCGLRLKLNCYNYFLLVSVKLWTLCTHDEILLSYYARLYWL